MTDKRTTPEGTEGMAEPPRPKKRAAPTIDLTVTEVQAAAAAGDPPPVQLADTAPPEPTPGPEQGDVLNRPSTHINVVSLSGGAAGAAIMTLVLGGLWLSGLVPARNSEPGVV